MSSYRKSAAKSSYSTNDAHSIADYYLLRGGGRGGGGAVAEAMAAAEDREREERIRARAEKERLITGIGGPARRTYGDDVEEERRALLAKRGDARNVSSPRPRGEHSYSPTATSYSYYRAEHHRHHVDPTTTATAGQSRDMKVVSSGVDDRRATSARLSRGVGRRRADNRDMGTSSDSFTSSSSSSVSPPRRSGRKAAAANENNKNTNTNHKAHGDDDDDREYASISPRRRYERGSSANISSRRAATQQKRSDTEEAYARGTELTKNSFKPSSGGYGSSSSAVSFHYSPTTPTPTLRTLPSNKEAADRLFAEYLRIINDKDEEIHRLIVELERANLELKKKDDKFKLRLKELKTALLNLQTTADDYKVKDEALAKATKENDALRTDVEKLRVTLTESEARMASLLKSNEKAMTQEATARQKLSAEHESYRKEWADKLLAVQQQAVAAEAQRDMYKTRNDEGEKDALRWKVEAQRLQEEAVETQRVVRELKRQAKEMKPIAAVELEIQQLEGRHKKLVDEYEREAERARRQNRELATKVNDFEVRHAELQHRHDELTRQVQSLRMSNQDADVLIAQLRLEKQQQAEDLRSEHQSQMRSLQQQIDKYYSDKIATEGELAVSRQRVNDLESAANSQAERFANDERRLHEHISSLKMQLNETSEAAESTQRRLQQQGQLLEQAEINVMQLQEDLRRAQQENRRNEDLKNQVVEGGRANEELRQRIRQHETALRDKEEALIEVRNDLDVARRDIRTEQTRKAQEVNDLSQKIRFLEDEAHAAQKRVLELSNLLATSEQKERAGGSMISELESGLARMKEAVKDRDKTIEVLRADVDRLNKRNEDLQNAVDKAHDVSVVERTEKIAINDRAAKLEGLLRQKEAEIVGLNEDVRRIEAAANLHEVELGKQLEQTRERVQSLVKELHASQQQVNLGKMEVSRAEAMAEERENQLHRTVIDPLTRKMEDLQKNISALHRDVEGREEKIREQNDLLNRQADLVEKLRVEVVSRDKRISSLEDGKETREREMSKRQTNLEEQLRELHKQLQELRDKEIKHMQELAARRSEVVTWRERCANLESLKTIADNAVEEYKARETDMLEKIEEMHQAQQIMQTCFDKQQEQIELGKRLREQDLGAGRGS